MRNLQNIISEKLNTNSGIFLEKLRLDKNTLVIENIDDFIKKYQCTVIKNTSTSTVTNILYKLNNKQLNNFYNKFCQDYEQKAQIIHYAHEYFYNNEIKEYAILKFTETKDYKIFIQFIDTNTIKGVASIYIYKDKIRFAYTNIFKSITSILAKLIDDILQTFGN